MVARRNFIGRVHAMLEITTTAEGKIDHEATIDISAPNDAVRDAFEAIWRIAGLPAGDLSRNPDGTYQAAHATQAWESYAATREWRAVLTAAKERG